MVGADHEMVAVASMTEAVREVGALGVPLIGTAAFEAEDAALFPIELVATTVNV
jgi:hypothetical protein